MTPTASFMAANENMNPRDSLIADTHQMIAATVNPPAAMK